MEKVLNQEEIDALVRAARHGGAGFRGPIVQHWDVRQAGQIRQEQMRSIGQLHEVFARNLTHSIGAYLRITFECSLVSAEHLTYIEFLQRIPEGTYVVSFNLAPLGVAATMQLDLSLAFPLLDVMLGGEGKSSDLRRETTEIEEQVLEGIMRIICRELQSTWQAIALEFSFGQRQRTAQMQRLMPPEEKNLCLSFEIKMPETRGTMNLAIPAVASNALQRKLSADASYQRPRSPVEARDRIQKKLMRCTFPVELAVPDLKVPLQEIVDLVPGTVLSFSRSIALPAEFQVEDVRLCFATPARVNARRAGRVLPVETPLPSAGEP